MGILLYYRKEDTIMKITVHETRITERELNEMACVGDLGEFEIQVWRREGKYIPHVHVYNDEPKNKKTHLDVCIQLEKAAYFSHGDHTGVLNASQCEKFNTFMHKPHKNGVFNSNYEFAVFLWNNMDDVKKFVLQKNEDGSVVIPDYSTITPYK